jgi:hypothetical protein
MYIHLTAHSTYSLQEGLLTPADLVQAAQDNGMSALGLTDRNLLTGAIEFASACTEVNIQPLVGLEIHLNDGPLSLLAASLEGWSSLCRLSSAVALRGNPDSPCSLDVLASYSKGLIALSSHPERLKDLFPNCLYVNLQDLSQATALSELALRLNLPTVVTHPIYYLTPDQAALQRTLAAVRLNRTITTLPTDAAASPDACFLSAQEMEERFKNYPKALATSQEIAERCKFDLPLGGSQMPTVLLPEGMTASQHLREKAYQGAIKLYGEITPTIQTRLDHELEIIARMGFEPIFLIVEEVLDFARQKGVPFSSRGSAASSLVAHCLGITSPDPLRLNLYFERFLNPARTTPPDIDTDLVRRTTARMIVRNVSQVKKNTCEVIRFTEKGNLNGKIARRKRDELGNRLPASSSRDLMIWVKLHCLKSSDTLETYPPLTQRSRSSPASNILQKSRCEILLSGTMVNETYQITKRHPTSSANVIHDCTAGLPTGREPYGNGNSIVVGGVTPTQRRSGKPTTGRRELGTIACSRKCRYA